MTVHAVQSPWIYQTIHAKHHANKVQRATEALRLTVVEEIVDVASSIAAVNLCGAHPLSRTVYNVVIVWLIIELHSGVQQMISYLLDACRLDVQLDFAPTARTSTASTSNLRLSVSGWRQ